MKGGPRFKTGVAIDMDYTELEKAGINLETLIERLMGNEALIKKFMHRFSENESFDELEAAIAKGDWKTACEASHMLKGMCGNLSITRLFDLFAEQVRLFRANENQLAVNMMEEIRVRYEYTMEHINNWLDE